VKKAKRAKFIKRYWGVHQGRIESIQKENSSPFGNEKTLDDIAAAVGESRDNIKKILKLNELIPELQELVSSGSMGQTAAYELAFLVQYWKIQHGGDRISSGQNVHLKSDREPGQIVLVNDGKTMDDVA
jgi:hypothetical protein